MSTGPEVPPYQLQTLLDEIFSQTSSQVTCAQALGNEIYVGTSNGELFQFMLQLDGERVESYVILARHTVPGEKPINEIVLIPSISRALIHSDRQIHFYILPYLEPDPIKPIRNVVAFAVDDQHLQRPAPKSNANLGYSTVVDPVEFAVVKRSAIALFSLKDRLFFLREIPLPQTQGSTTTLAKRAGKYLCFADRENYNMVDLEGAQLFPLLPIAQGPGQDGAIIKPMISVISENEFLVLSWTGTNTMGLFITGDGDPVRGTLEWPAYPLGLCHDYPHITTLLPDGTVEVHSVDTQAQLQVIGPPPTRTLPIPVTSPTRSPPVPSPDSEGMTPGPLPQRIAMVASVGGYYVPSVARSECLRKVPFKLLRV